MTGTISASFTGADFEFCDLRSTSERGAEGNGGAREWSVAECCPPPERPRSQLPESAHLAKGSLQMWLNDGSGDGETIWITQVGPVTPRILTSLRDSRESRRSLEEECGGAGRRPNNSSRKASEKEL